jgi:hypothetical protein
MPIQIDWFDPKRRLIQVCFIGEWNLRRYRTLIDISNSMIQSVSHKVHLIHDFSQSQSTPRDLLVGMQYANKKLLANQGLTVLINANSVIKSYVLMAKRTGLPAVTHIYHATTLEEALQVIRKNAYRVKTS